MGQGHVVRHYEEHARNRSRRVVRLAGREVGFPAEPQRGRGGVRPAELGTPQVGLGYFITNGGSSKTVQVMTQGMSEMTILCEDNF